LVQEHISLALAIGLQVLVNVRCFRNVEKATAASFVTRKAAIAYSIVMRTSTTAAGGSTAATSAGGTTCGGDGRTAPSSGAACGVSSAATNARASS
jgi:hypothetical protein